MLNDKVILITGGTGSFGKKFTQMIMDSYKPKKIIIYSRDEFKQDELRKELFEKYPGRERTFRFFIGDVRDRERLMRAFVGVDYVIHGAAMKQVPTCEYNPFEAIKTNIYGAQNIVDAAIDTGVKKVVALSTDKAVNPINLYGGTKLVSDKLFITGNAYTGGKGTVFSVVRYGNVAGSRGSVIPFFQELVRHGSKELPITDFRMTRFYITLEEGVKLVFKALEEAKGGETYISKIPSFKVTDLAKAISPEATLKEVGVRPGEKLHEAMITKEDSMFTFEYDRHFIIYPYEYLDGKRHLVLPGGKQLSYGFEYNSSTNDSWLSVEELKEQLKLIKY